MAVDRADDTCTGEDLHIARQAGRLGGAADRHGDRMLALGFDGRRQGEHPALLDVGDRRHLGDRGEALGQGSGLVEDHGVRPGQSLERITASHENSQC